VRNVENIAVFLSLITYSCLPEIKDEIKFIIIIIIIIIINMFVKVAFLVPMKSSYKNKKKKAPRTNILLPEC